MKIGGPIVKKSDVLEAIRVWRDNVNATPIAGVDALLAILDEVKSCVEKTEQAELPLAGVIKVVMNISVFGPQRAGH